MANHYNMTLSATDRTCYALSSTACVFCSSFLFLLPFFVGDGEMVMLIS